MSKTSAQLVARALNKLGAVGAGQAPSAEDAALVEDEIAPLMDDLMVRGIYAWGDPDAIDDAAFLHVADLLANSVARDFGRQQDETLRLMAEKRLRELEPMVLSGQAQKAEYF